jgi:hypothetical protein
MKDYRFHTLNGRVIIRDDELVLPAPHRSQHWPKADVAAVRIDGLTTVRVGDIATYGVLTSHAPDHHTGVRITRNDGTSRQYENISESPLEVAAQFNVRGYPVAALARQAAARATGRLDHPAWRNRPRSVRP